MAGKVNVFGLGTSGVNLVKSVLEMNDDELRSAQNAEPSKTLGFPGLKKRDGFATHSTSSLNSSPIRGGIGLPLPPPGDNGLAPIFVAKTPSIISIPTAGLTWTQRSFGSAINGFQRIVWASGLSKFVVAGGASATARYAYSSDGITWTLVAGATQFRAGLVWTGSILVALGTQLTTSCVQTSPDGIVWTTQTAQWNAAGNSWLALAYSPSLGLLVAVGNSGRIMTSPDGVTWTFRTSPTAVDNWYSIAWSADLGKFVAFGTIALDPTTYLMTSTDGINWTGATTTAIHLGYATHWELAWSSTLGFFVACEQVNDWGGSNVAVSANGTTWFLETSPSGRYVGIAVAEELSQVLIVGNSGAPTGHKFASSLDGFTYNNEASPADLTWENAAYSPTLHRWCVVADSTATDGNVATADAEFQAIWIDSTDAGATWATTPLLTRALSTATRRTIRTTAGVTVYPGGTVGQIFAWDGQNEYLLTTLPTLSSTPISRMALIASNGSTVYAVADDGTTQWMFAIDAGTGAVTKVGAALTVANDLIVAGAWYLGRLFVCSTNGTADVTKASHIYSLRPVLETAWTTEETSTIATGANYYQYTDCGAFLGALYVSASVTGAASKIRQRTVAGVWSFVFTGPDSAAGDSSYFIWFRAILAAPKLVVGYYDARTGADHTGLIYSTSDGVTWTSEYDYKNNGGATGPLLGMWQQGFSVYATANGHIFKRDATGAWSNVYSHALTGGMIVAI